MTPDEVQTNLRLPTDLKDRLITSAAQNKRSLSAEVAARLSDSYQVDDAHALLLDQAVQIWELRKRIAQGYAAMGEALAVLRHEPGFDQAEVIGTLKTAMNQASEDAGQVLNRVLTEYSDQADAGQRALLAKLLSAVTNHDFTEKP